MRRMVKRLPCRVAAMLACSILCSTGDIKCTIIIKIIMMTTITVAMRTTTMMVVVKTTLNHDGEDEDDDYDGKPNVPVN